MIVAAIGNPFEGLELYGPFKDHDKAIDWCDKLDYEEWYIVHVEHVNDQHMGKVITDLMVAHSYEQDHMNILEKILDLCQEHGVESDMLNELQCIEDNGCRSSEM